MASRETHRSPLLMNRDDSAVLLIDVQERFQPTIDRWDDMVRRCEFVLRSARILNMPILATEQYPKGLGRTVEPLASIAGPAVEKLVFSSCGAPAVMDWLAAAAAPKVLVCGIEAHVCVQQTALDLLAAGYKVYIPADAVASRTPTDRQFAIERMARAGAVLTTAESAVFEWLKAAGSAEFKQIQELIKSAGK